MSDTSIELTWDLAYEKEGIINYELRYRDSLGTQARILALPFWSVTVFGITGRAFVSPHAICLPSFHVRSLNNFCQQMKKAFAPTSSYVVEGLRPNTEYHFSLAAISNKGIGAFTNEISQKTFQASM